MFIGEGQSEDHQDESIRVFDISNVRGTSPENAREGPMEPQSLESTSKGKELVLSMFVFLGGGGILCGWETLGVLLGKYLVFKFMEVGYGFVSCIAFFVDCYK